ncbi:PREDICTED: sialic acid-binding Ig-like lectin 5 [Cyprinodon variegatus]|uniref:sialic acid-binding Ig-like lectin 5 n=1 Tax=Cyprinodon variegatus TaxID=28743 RepID=UPI000742ABEB|nr:PREDICTED: sialic acid-binding Ig-like lectin 5 [Cyprinodon variegatus]
MISHFVVHFCILGSLYGISQAWDVKMPKHIKGLLGSCLTIPCSFDYYWNPPRRPDRVVWYQYVSRGYPLVYDKWYPNDVIPLYKGRTSVLGYRKSCSLKIETVKWNDHRQKLYPWVDPENVGRSTYAFYETTVTIEVIDSPKAPEITITGERKAGNTVTVKCSAEHTCFTNRPNLYLNIPLRNEYLTHNAMSDGTIITSLTTDLVLDRDYQVVECTVWHPGGKRAETSETLYAECSFSSLTIRSSSSEYLEGVASTVTCSVSYTCSNNKPTFTWNYANMPATSNTYKDGTWWKTTSTLTFTPSAKDHGNHLRCSAHFPGRSTQDRSIPILVKKIKMNELPGELTEGVEKSVICSVSYKCKKSRPTIEWNYSDMQSEIALVRSENYGSARARFNDFYKAFDSVEHPFILSTIKHFGFGVKFREFIRGLYRDISSCVLRRSGTTPSFKVNVGIPQGCPISPYLFI